MQREMTHPRPSRPVCIEVEAFSHFQAASALHTIITPVPASHTGPLQISHSPTELGKLPTKRLRLREVMGPL